MATSGMEMRRALASGRSPRRRSPARVDLAIAGVLVVGLIASGALGIALAAVAALGLLAARAAWLAAAALARRVAPRPTRAGGRRRRLSRSQRIVRILTMAALLALPLASVSYAIAVSAPSNSSLAIRTVEWMRDNGAGSMVSTAESFFYTLTAPSKGGPGLARLPTAGAHVPHAMHALAPPNLPAVIHPRLPGEGVWQPTQPRFSAARAPVLVTTYRPDPSYPRVVAGIARIDPHRARLGLYPGLKEPGGSGPRGSAAVPGSLRPRLLAVFNSGFKHVDGHGGFFASGHLYQPLVKGQGTIVASSDGRFDVRSWTGGSSPGPGIALARQNLPLIVDAGQPNPALGDGSKWGTTVGNAVLVWRSGLGIDRHGNLLYAAANYQSARGLARVLIHAGAVRAVELDINSYWVSFNAFASPGGRSPQKLLPDIGRPATRYLSPDDRDFFTVYAR
jgi:hypothetical protein